jgi:hypothetical protein
VDTLTLDSAEDLGVFLFSSEEVNAEAYGKAHWDDF